MGDARYTMGRSHAETARLIRQSQLYEDLTRSLIKESGIERGMRVLDVGSGAGDVAFAAAEWVGPSGKVVGVDVNAAILDTARARAKEQGFANVAFVAGDARTLDLGGDFDALIGRLVLMYMSDPADALKQLATRLRPGGIVAFQEFDATLYGSLAHPDTPLMNELIGWALEVFERSGAHLGMGLDLHRTFVDAGLPAPILHFAAPVGGAKTWAGHQFIADSFQSFIPLLREYGIATPEEVGVETLPERLQREVMASKRPLVLPPLVTAWARKTNER